MIYSRRSDNTRSARRRTAQHGQILVVFAGALVAIIAVAGLVLDGGRAFAARRGGQNAADLAAVGGAIAYLNGTGAHAARAAVAVAASAAIASINGYATSTGSSVSITVTLIVGGARVKVDIGRPQRNYFASLVGQPTWLISTTATALASDLPNGANGAMPLIFNRELWIAGGPEPDEETIFNLPSPGNEDVPLEPGSFNWTVYCTANGSGNPCNANSNDVRQIIDGFGENKTIWLDDLVGPLNAGSHTTLFEALAAHIGKEMPVLIVDDAGGLQGWAMFRLTGSQGGSVKQIRGYFVGPAAAPPLVVGDNHGHASAVFGGYVVRLVD